MTPDRWERAKSIFAAAIQLDPSLRQAFVQSACGPDHGLYEEVLSLLAADSTDTVLRSPLSDRTTRTRLNNRYRVERELGRGGLGVVYLAHDETLHDRPVVVKMPIDPTPRDPWLAEKFAQEVKALSIIDHPGVVGALDSGVASDGRPFLVIQYVEGRSLKDAMTPEGVPLEFAARVLREIGEALGAAHARGVWHRDLKPPNIMLQRLEGGREYARLIDFGIASIHSAPTGEIATRVAGTPLYMAPEQFDGRVSAASDIYSMGVIAYELVTGRKPFAGSNEREQHDLQRAGVSVKPSQLRAGVSSQADRLILQALAFQPKDRPAAAARFGEDLAAALVSTEAPRALPPPSRRKALVAGIASAVVALGGGGAVGIWWLGGNSAKDEKDSVAWSIMVQPGGTGPALAANPAQPLAVSDAFYLTLRGPRGYFYLLSDEPAKDALVVLASPQIRPGETNRIPDDHRFLFDGPSVMELWCAWSRDPLPELEPLRKLINENERGIVGDPALRARTRQYLAGLPQPRPSTQPGNTETTLTGSRRFAWKVRVEAK